MYLENSIKIGKKVSIRNSTFELFFLLLGATELTEKDKVDLGVAVEDQTDYYKLCEYVHYHNGYVFYLDFGGKEIICFGCADPYSKVLDNTDVGYSGVYFKEFGKGVG